MPIDDFPTVMPGMQSRSPARALRTIAAFGGFAVLIAAYLLIGVVGHDPWKQDEPYVFGIALDILRSGDWVVPTIAGEPFVEKPPLYYLLAAFCAWLGSPLLALHDAARLASAVCTGATMLCAARAARVVWGRRVSMATCMLVAGTLGLLLPARQMLPDLALLAGFAMAFVGLVEAGRDGRSAAVWLGTGAGLAFLGKGLIGPGALALASLLVMIDADFRRASYVRMLAKSALFALPWIVIWPVALYLRSPDLFVEWFWHNNIGRFTGFAVPRLGASHLKGFWWYTLLWFTFPVLPLALLALRRIRTVRQTRFRSVAVATAGVFGAVLLSAASARETYALPLLVPLAVLAAGAMRPLDDRLDRRLAWAAAAAWGPLILWLVAIWATRDQPGLVFGSLLVAKRLPLSAALPQNALLWWSVTSALVVAGAVAVLASPHLRIPRWLVVWVAGIDLALCALLVLWLPWLDHAKSYRQVFESIAHAVPERPACMDSLGLGESERAMLEYEAALRTHRLETGPSAGCPWLLVQGRDWVPSGEYATGWTLVWSGHRPGDDNELFRIYRQQAPEAHAALERH